MCAGSKIAVENSVVDLDGDEMTRYVKGFFREDED